jgi:hypothetical protein
LDASGDRNAPAARIIVETWVIRLGDCRCGVGSGDIGGHSAITGSTLLAALMTVCLIRDAQATPDRHRERRFPLALRSLADSRRPTMIELNSVASKGVDELADSPRLPVAERQEGFDPAVTLDPERAAIPRDDRCPGPCIDRDYVTRPAANDLDPAAHDNRPLGEGEFSLDPQPAAIDND